MDKINIAILHGIGKNEVGYADDFIKGIHKIIARKLAEDWVRMSKSEID